MKKLIVETEKLKDNIEKLQSMTSSKIIAVLKGNAYGLGLVEIARIMLESGIDFIAVSEIEEALKLRSEGISGNILLMSSTSDHEQIDHLLNNDITLTVGSFNALTAVNSIAGTKEHSAAIHIKLDTGFGRYGFMPDQMDKLSSALKESSNVTIGGTYTHLSSAFAKKPTITFKQFETFSKCIDQLKHTGIDPGILHISNSSAFLQYENLHLDAVRIGSAFLGRVPLLNRWGLHRIGYLQSYLSEIKTLPAKHSVGYANTYSTRSEVRIGIVPVGYMDGFGVEKKRDTFRFMDIVRYMYHDIKSFKKQLYVRVKGQNVRILGRINMFNIIVDLSGIDAEIGDEVILDINPLFVNPEIEREYV